MSSAVCTVAASLNFLWV